MPYLIDTDVLIDVTKGKEAAMNLLDRLPENWSISVVTAMEIVVGARDKKDLAKLEQFLASVTVVPLSPSMGFTSRISPMVSRSASMPFQNRHCTYRQSLDHIEKSCIFLGQERRALIVGRTAARILELEV